MTNSTRVLRNSKDASKSYQKSPDEALKEFLKQYGFAGEESIQKYNQRTTAVAAPRPVTSGNLETVLDSISISETNTTPTKVGTTPIRRSYAEVVSPKKLPNVAAEETQKESRTRAASGDSGYSESNHSSNPEVELLRERKILVTHRTKTEVGSTGKSRTTVKFAINSDQRAKTYLGDSQGDHVSSYLFLTYSLLSGVRNERGIDEAIEKMKNVGNKILLRDGKKKIQSISVPNLLPREGRHTTLESVPEASTLNLDNGNRFENFPLRQEVEADLIYAKINKKAEYLTDIASCLLTEIQQDPLATVYSKGRIKRNESGQIVKSDDEGPVVKKSARGLMLLDTLCYLHQAETDDAFDEKIGNFVYSLKARNKEKEETEENHLARYGFNAWFEDDGTKADEVKKQFRQIAHKEPKGSTAYRDKQKEFIGTLIGELLEIDSRTHKVSEFMGGLFDYDRRVEFDCKKAFPLGERGVSELTQVKTDRGRMNFLKERTLDQINDKFESGIEPRQCNFNGVSVTNEGIVSGNLYITRNDPNLLAQVVVKHQDMMNIFCHNIQQYNSVRYERMQKEFLQREVFEKGGWNDLKRQTMVAIKGQCEQQEQIEIEI